MKRPQIRSSGFSLSAVSGVACVSPSMGQFFNTYAEAPTAAGNAIIANARPSMAGLKMFCPSPPKITLPNPIATKAPTAPTYHGACAGNDNARMAPVTTAEKSLKVARLPRIAMNNASAASALTMQITS